MAEEKPRAPRARKKTTEAETKAAEGKTTAKRPSRAKAAASAPKPAATKKKTAAATSRAKKKAAVPVQPGDIATLAYLIWEHGEPGDANDHWLRAEQELAAA